MSGLAVSAPQRLLAAATREGALRTLGIVLLSVAGGLLATWLVPQFISWIPYDYAVYMKGARMVRAGLDPYAALPYWYPLPIVLFTTLPWSFLPDQFAWAFAFIPLGLLHLRYGRNAILWWLFFPLLINVAYAQAEGWLILPLAWLLEDRPVMGSIGALGLMFKPAYAFLLLPLRMVEWLQARRWKEWIVILGMGLFMTACAFLVDREWPLHWLNGVLHRAENRELIARNMTVWPLLQQDNIRLAAFFLLVGAFVLLSLPLLRRRETRGHVLLAASLFFFPNGLNPVSSMMVMPMVQTRREILALVLISWLTAGLDILVGGSGVVYLVIVLAALLLVARRNLKSE